MELIGPVSNKGRAEDVFENSTLSMYVFVVVLFQM